VDVSGGSSLPAAATDPTTITPPALNLSISKSHTGNFTLGQTGFYTINVSNPKSSATNGAITVTDTLPAGLSLANILPSAPVLPGAKQTPSGPATLTSMSGLGWNCANNTCTRTDPLNPGGSYPP